MHVGIEGVTNNFSMDKIHNRTLSTLKKKKTIDNIINTRKLPFFNKIIIY